MERLVVNNNQTQEIIEKEIPFPIENKWLVTGMFGFFVRNIMDVNVNYDMDRLENKWNEWKNCKVNTLLVDILSKPENVEMMKTMKERGIF